MLDLKLRFDDFQYVVLENGTEGLFIETESEIGSDLIRNTILKMIEERKDMIIDDGVINQPEIPEEPVEEESW